MSEAPAAAVPATGGWRPTHVVLNHDMPAWESPDATKPAAATLGPWLEVQVGSWAHDHDD